MLSFITGIVGAAASMTVLIWAYFHMSSYSIWWTIAVVSVVFIALGFALGFTKWVAQRAKSFALGVFLGGVFFLMPFAVNTFGYAFILLPAIALVAVLSYLSIQVGRKLVRKR